MTVPLTPDTLAAAYDYLRTTPPFKGWRLPPADEVGFHVVVDPSYSADFSMQDGLPLIRVSVANNGLTTTLLATMAHEMIHLRQHMTGDREHHGPRFKRAAARICRVHGFDPKVF